MTTAILLCLAGLVGLALGGELLVRGAVGIAMKLGVSTLFTGLVIVGSATSMPEMVASVQAALDGSPGIAWGNIVGSNIANALLILGVSALIAPIMLNGIGRRDAVVAMGVSLLLWGLALAGLGARWVGAAMLVLIVVYVVWRYRHPGGASANEEPVEAPGSTWVAAGLFIAGLAALVISGNALVTGAVDLARVFGVSETAIGLTIVAVGTSLPELAASVAAAIRGQSGLAIGNVVGSNIYNILLIGGVTMTIAPFAVPTELLPLQMPLLAASALLVLGMLWFANRIGRMLGAVLTLAFIGNVALVFS